MEGKKRYSFVEKDTMSSETLPLLKNARHGCCFMGLDVAVVMAAEEEQRNERLRQAQRVEQEVIEFADALRQFDELLKRKFEIANNQNQIDCKTKRGLVGPTEEPLQSKLHGESTKRPQCTRGRQRLCCLWW